MHISNAPRLPHRWSDDELAEHTQRALNAFVDRRLAEPSTRYIELLRVRRSAVHRLVRLLAPIDPANPDIAVIRQILGNPESGVGAPLHGGSAHLGRRSRSCRHARHTAPHQTPHQYRPRTCDRHSPADLPACRYRAVSVGQGQPPAQALRAQAGDPGDHGLACCAGYADRAAQLRQGGGALPRKPLGAGRLSEGAKSERWQDQCACPLAEGGDILRRVRPLRPPRGSVDWAAGRPHRRGRSQGFRARLSTASSACSTTRRRRPISGTASSANPSSRLLCSPASSAWKISRAPRRGGCFSSGPTISTASRSGSRRNSDPGLSLSGTRLR